MVGEWCSVECVDCVAIWRIRILAMRVQTSGSQVRDRRRSQQEECFDFKKGVSEPTSPLWQVILSQSCFFVPGKGRRSLFPKHHRLTDARDIETGKREVGRRVKKTLKRPGLLRRSPVVIVVRIFAVVVAVVIDQGYPPRAGPAF